MTCDRGRRWLRRMMVRRARRKGPGPRVIVTGRPYDWQLDGFGDELYGPVVRVPKPQVVSHVDTARCNPRGHSNFVDEPSPPMLD